MLSERENIRGFWFYYLRASGKWHVFIHVRPDMIKVASDVNTLQEARQIAQKYTYLKGE